LRGRREGRFTEAASHWQELLALTEAGTRRRDRTLAALREFAIEALAIHHEHRVRDLDTARELALFALEEDTTPAYTHGMRHRLARLERKLAKKQNAQLF
jgi:hypothetical protein